MSWGFRTALPLTGGSDQGGYAQIYKTQIDRIMRQCVYGCDQLQDVLDREHNPSSSSSRDQDADRSSSSGGGGAGPAAGGSTPQSDGFSVRGAPWSSAAPDTSSMDDFPDLAQVQLLTSTVKRVFSVC